VKPDAFTAGAQKAASRFMIAPSSAAEVPVGSIVKIEYLGKEKAKSGNEYNNFKVLYAPAPMKEVVNAGEEAKF